MLEQKKPIPLTQSGLSRENDRMAVTRSRHANERMADTPKTMDWEKDVQERVCVPQPENHQPGHDQWIHPSDLPRQAEPNDPRDLPNDPGQGNKETQVRPFSSSSNKNSEIQLDWDNLFSTIPPPGILFVTASYDHTLRFWDVAEAACVRTISCPDQTCVLSLSHDKRLLLAGGMAKVRLYDAISTTQPKELATYLGHTHNVVAVGFFQSDRQFYTAGEDSTARIWDLRQTYASMILHCKSPIHSAVLHPNQQWLITGEDAGTVRVWDIRMSKPDRCIYQYTPEPRSPIYSLCISEDGSWMIACTSLGECLVWINPGIHAPGIGRNMGMILRRKPSHDSGSLHMSDSNPWSCLRPSKRFPAHTSYVTKSIMSLDHRFLATSSADKTVRIWCMDRDFSLYRVLRGHLKWVWDCAFAKDSTFLFTTSTDHVAKMWNIHTGQCIRTYGGHQKGVIALAMGDSLDPTP